MARSGHWWHTAASFLCRIDCSFSDDPPQGNQLAFQQEVAKDNIMRLGVRGPLALSVHPTIAIAAKGWKMRPSFSPDGWVFKLTPPWESQPENYGPAEYPVP